MSLNDTIAGNPLSNITSTLIERWHIGFSFPLNKHKPHLLHSPYLSPVLPSNAAHIIAPSCAKSSSVMSGLRSRNAVFPSASLGTNNTLVDGNTITGIIVPLTFSLEMFSIKSPALKLRSLYSSPCTSGDVACNSFTLGNAIEELSIFSNPSILLSPGNTTSSFALTAKSFSAILNSSF